MFSSVLCAVDFSEQSQRALTYAAAFTARAKGQLTVLHVNDPLLATAAEMTFGRDYLARETEDELARTLKELSRAAGAWLPKLRTVTAVGEPAHAIVDTSARVNADTIVIGTHGLSGYRKAFLGSVAEHVLQHATVPVLAVPLAERERINLTPDGPEFDLCRIMAPVDFGEQSEAHARVARDLAQDFGVPLVLIHVVTQVRAPERWQESLTARERIALAEGKDRLERLASSLGTAVTLERLVPVGAPADEIAAAAAEHEVGLIVMGLRGAGGLLRSERPGTIAYRVLTLVGTPVLALPR
jgi:nucleotide-binding universal stress UspA family protein